MVHHGQASLWSVKFYSLFIKHGKVLQQNACMAVERICVLGEGPVRDVFPVGSLVGRWGDGFLSEKLKSTPSSCLSYGVEGRYHGAG